LRAMIVEQGGAPQLLRLQTNQAIFNGGAEPILSSAPIARIEPSIDHSARAL
jgi:hypothetical protein